MQRGFPWGQRALYCGHRDLVQELNSCWVALLNGYASSFAIGGSVRGQEDVLFMIYTLHNIMYQNSRNYARRCWVMQDSYHQQLPDFLHETRGHVASSEPKPIVGVYKYKLQT